MKGKTSIYLLGFWKDMSLFYVPVPPRPTESDYQPLSLPTDFSKHVKQKVSATYLYVQNLEERVAYTFSVRALTIDYGTASVSGSTEIRSTGYSRPAAALCHDRMGDLLSNFRASLDRTK